MNGDNITVKQACNDYNIARRTLYNWADKGLISIGSADGTATLNSAELITLLRSKGRLSKPSDSAIFERIEELLIKNNELLAQLIENINRGMAQERHKDSNKQVGRPVDAGNQADDAELNIPMSLHPRTKTAINKARSYLLTLSQDNQAVVTPTDLGKLSGVNRATITKYSEYIFHGINRV